MTDLDIMVLRGGAPSPLDTQAKRIRIERLGARLIPPRPDFQLIPPAQTPPPPKILPRDTPHEWRPVLLNLYRSNYWATYGTAPGVGASGTATHRLKAAGAMDRAFEALRDLDIAPAVWVAFSFAAWQQTPRASYGAPPLRWVFSATRVRERRDWYYDWLPSAVSAEVQICADHAELDKDWGRMWDDLLASNPTTRPEVAVIVHRYFPGDEYDLRMARAKTGNRELQSRINHRVAVGEAVWQ